MQAVASSAQSHMNADVLRVKAFFMQNTDTEAVPK